MAGQSSTLTMAECWALHTIAVAHGRRCKLAIIGSTATHAVTRILIGGAFLGTFTFAAIAATSHDNQVVFSVNGPQSFSFQQTGYSITSGQPYEGTTAGIDNGQGVINVIAGRNGTTGPATWFKQQVGAGQTIVCDASGTYPAKLNFAEEGTLTIGSVDGKTITCDSIIIAQGNFGQTNNWWMGGPKMSGARSV